MFLNKKHKKIVNVLWGAISVLVVIGMILFSMPFLFQ